MNKKILILAITSSLIISSIPFAEASIGWNGFLRDIGFGGSQTYEVSGVSLVPSDVIGGSGSHEGNEVQLRCEGGDWFLIGDTREKSVFVTLDVPPNVLDNELIVLSGSIVEEFPFNTGNIAQGFSQPIGWDGHARQSRSFQAIDIPVIITGLCFSPSPLTNGAAIGGEWQSSDTVALFIGYSVLNAYWLVPTMAGVGVGVYLTKSKWKKN